MQNLSVIRVVDEQLVWYPPGASDEPRALDDDVSRAALRATLSQRRATVCFAAPGEQVRLLPLPVTAAEKKHISKSLPFVLEEEVAEEIDSLHFAHVPIDAQTIAVAICARDAMLDWQALLADFPGVSLWLPEPLLLPWRAGEWCLVLEGDKVLLRSGACEGFGIEREMLAPFLQALLEAGAPDALIVYGNDQGADLALLPDSLAALSQWRRGDLYAAMLVADNNELPRLNLRQGDFMARLPLRKWWSQWRSVAAVATVAVVLQMGALYADYRKLSEQNLALRTAVQDSYRQAFPRGQVVDAEKQLRRQLDALRGTGQGSGFITLVEQVGAAVAGLPDTSIATINYNDKADEMRMNVLAADFEGVERLRSRINEAGLDAVMESSNVQGQQVRARLRVGKRS